MFRNLLALGVILLALSRSFANEERTVVVLGDSIAAGFGVDLDEAFPAILDEKIKSAGLPYKVVNAGVSGDTTASGARRISWLLRNRVDVLLIELGGNDGLRGIKPEETARNLQQIIDKLREKNPSARIVIAGMQMANNMGDDYNLAYREVFPSIAKTNSLPLIPFLLEGVGGKAELNQPDRIHPTPEGHRIVADNVWKVLEPVLKNTEPVRAASGK